MKKFFATFLILLSFTAMGQKINKEILGLRVGGYGIPQRVSRMLDNKFNCYSSIYQKSSSYSIVASNIPFAGNSWDRLTVNITSNYHIAEIILLDVCGSKEDTDLTFYSFCSMLEEKYGKPQIDRINSKQWGEGTCVSIDRLESPSKSNPDKPFYRVELSYYDEKYSEQLSSDIFNEL